MNRYIEVPADTMFTYLRDRKFEETTEGNEVVFVRRGEKCPAMVMKVYTSVAKGHAAARAKDADAIRVALVGELKGEYNGKPLRPKGFFSRKILRVNSVEGVLERIRDACCEAAEVARQYERVCAHCGSPAYTDSGNCYVKSCREAHRNSYAQP
jgi:hypothetical protein